MMGRPGSPSEKLLARIEAQRWEWVRGDSRSLRQPVIIQGLCASWPALREWTPRRLAERFGGEMVPLTLDLPEHGVPYYERSNAHLRQMRLADAVDHMQRVGHCYLNQLPFGRLPLAGEADLSTVVKDLRGTHLWVGAQTHSGLHYDQADNYLFQVYGKKDAILVAPAETSLVYPFPDNVTKSQIDPERPQLVKFPRYELATLWTGTLNSGDMLFIPRGWWHYLAAPELSVSLNCWHGPSLSRMEQSRMIWKAGPRAWARIIRDFVWHGAMGKEYEPRMFCPPPTGLDLYRALRSALHSRVV